MSAPTKIERAHYDKLVGRKITAIVWQQIEGQALPVLVLDGQDREGNAASVAVLADPEGNGRGHRSPQLPCQWLNCHRDRTSGDQIQQIVADPDPFVTISEFS